MTDKRAFKGIWIPAEVWLSEELTLLEKVFFVEIDSLDNEEGCFAGNDYFSKFFKLSKTRCSEVINSLEKKGFINIKYVYKENSKQLEKRIIKINKGIRKIEYPLRETEAPLRKVEDPPSENCKDNNTYINNTINNSMYIYKENHQENKNLKEFSRLYEQNIGFINGVTAEYLIDLSETIDVKLFKRAIEIATDKGSCNLGYIKGIIRQWLNTNITTLEQLEAYKLQQSQNNKNMKGAIKDDTRGRTEIKSAKNVGEKENNMPTREEMLRQIRELDNE